MSAKCQENVSIETLSNRKLFKLVNRRNLQKPIDINKEVFLHYKRTDNVTNEVKNTIECKTIQKITKQGVIFNPSDVFDFNGVLLMHDNIDVDMYEKREHKKALNLSLESMSTKSWQPNSQKAVLSNKDIVHTRISTYLGGKMKTNKKQVKIYRKKMSRRISKKNYRR